MRLGIFAKTFPGSQPEPVLTAVAAAGFDHHCVKPIEVEQLQRLLRDAD